MRICFQSFRYTRKHHTYFRKLPHRYQISRNKVLTSKRTANVDSLQKKVKPFDEANCADFDIRRVLQRESILDNFHSHKENKTEANKLFLRIEIPDIRNNEKDSSSEENMNLRVNVSKHSGL